MKTLKTVFFAILVVMVAAFTCDTVKADVDYLDPESPHCECRTELGVATYSYGIVQSVDVYGDGSIIVNLDHNNNTITITGHGKLPDCNLGFGDEENLPYNHAPYKLIIGEGITYIGYDNFTNYNIFKTLSSISIPSTVTQISTYAFEFANGQTLDIPGTVKIYGSTEPKNNIY